MSQEKVRVTIYVEGGVVQHVDSPSFVDVKIIDFDNEDTEDNDTGSLPPCKLTEDR